MRSESRTDSAGSPEDLPRLFSRVTVLARPRIAVVRQSFMEGRDERFSFDALEDLDTMAEVMQRVALKDGSEPLATR